MLKWIWVRMHKGNLKMPADRLIFEGEHDLIYLYSTGFVDTERYTPDQWILAFSKSCQKNGSYILTEEQWLEKAQYRYSGPVEPPFDPMTIREGEWTEDEWIQFIKEKFLPETTVPFDQFVHGINTAKKRGEIKDGIVVMTAEKKKGIVRLLNQYASPRRKRALSVDGVRQRVRQHDEFEAGRPMITQTQSAPVTRQHEDSKFKSSPDQQKQSAGKLTDLLSGSKK